MPNRYRLYNGFRLNLGLKRKLVPHPVASFLIGLLAPQRLRLPQLTLHEFLGTIPPPISFWALAEPTVNSPPTDIVPICSIAKAIGARRILEVGTYNGASALNFALACPEATITTYDVRPEAGELLVLAEPAMRRRIVTRTADFSGERSRLASESPYDLIFIDGDHKSEAVQNDSALALEYVRPGGVVAWHDYRHLGHEWLSCENMVPEVLNSLARQHRIFHLQGTAVAVWRRPDS